MPTNEKWALVFFGIFFELILVLYLIKAGGKGVGELLPIIAFSFFYWGLILFFRNLRLCLSLLVVMLVPYNRFIILSVDEAYLLGRVSDYLLISLHFFEIPLYTCAGLIFFHKLFDLKNRTKKLVGKIHLPHFFILFLIVSILFVLINKNFLFGFSRVQLIFDFILIYFCLAELSFYQIFFCLSASSVVQSIISILQAGFNRSIGLQNLGESVFNESLFYIAKSFIFHQFRVRAYGTFPHPNVLSAFLFISTILLFFFIIKEASSKKLYALNLRILGRVGVISLFLLAVYLTQSRTVILSLIISLAFILLRFIAQNFLGYSKKILISLTALLIVLVSFVIFRERILSLATYDSSSVGNRVDLQEFAISSVKESKLLGFGPNGYLKYLSENRGVLTNYSFIVEPVHNIFLLILSEYGVVFFILFIFQIFYLFLKSVSRNFRSENINIVFPIIIFLILSLNLDHYLLTLKQGVFIFALCLYLIDSKIVIEDGA